MSPTTLDVRTQMLEAAEALLDASPAADLSTRAVCDAVGVGAPVLYRLFGDKQGLLSAVVDYGFDRYLATKRAAEPSDDPVEDLRSGWDTHVAFALAHPTVYRLMFSPSFAAVPGAATEALRLLREVLDRCAAAGRLRIDPALAAQTIMSANVGVALSLVAQPDTYTDPDLSARVRDAVHARLLTTDTPTTTPDVPTTALQLAAQLRAAPSSNLTATEQALLLEWLDRLQAESEPARVSESGASSPGRRARVQARRP